jgi:hypothetical protein
MVNRPSVIERAFQLARSGRCATVADIRLQLTEEQYTTAESVIRGGALINQLKILIGAARMAPVV